MQKYVTEFLGTFFLVLAVGITGNAIAIGLFITALIYIGGRISGAHYNPAITIAFWACRGMPSKKMMGYLGSQFIGAIFAAATIFYLAGTAYQAVPPSASTTFQFSLIEILFTLVLALLYLTFFIGDDLKGNHIYGLAIGVTYIAIIVLGEPISGGIYNPALATGTSIMDYFDFGTSYNYLPAYLLAPTLGGLFAGHLFNFLRNRSHSPKED